MLTLSLSWTVDVNRPGLLSRFRYPRLPDVYRGASQFAGALEAAKKVAIAHVRCDEEATTTCVPASHDDADILYASGHGELNLGHYDFCLHDKNWSVCNGSLGGQRLRVAIFDTCNLIDTANAIDVHHWNMKGIGASLRLLLGFDGLAFMMRPSTDRGVVFARNLLSGLSFADAWLKAVQITTIAPYNRAVAIGIGDSQADAQAMLNTTLAAPPPGPRVAVAPVFEKKY